MDCPTGGVTRLLVPAHPIRVATDSVGCAGIGGILDPAKPYTHHYLGCCWLIRIHRRWSPLHISLLAITLRPRSCETPPRTPTCPCGGHQRHPVRALELYPFHEKEPGGRSFLRRMSISSTVTDLAVGTVLIPSRLWTPRRPLLPRAQ